MSIYCTNPHSTLLDILRRDCLVYKPEGIVLSSGRQSHYYVDCSKLLNSRSLCLVGHVLYSFISLKVGPIDTIAGMELGAVPLMVSVANKACEFNHSVNVLIVRKQSKQHGLKDLIEGDVVPNANVVIIDDVVTTGQSIVKVINVLNHVNLHIKAIVALVNRHEGCDDLFQSMQIPFYYVYSINELLDEKESK